MTLLVPHNLEDKREITETNNSIQRELVSEEEERHSSIPARRWRDAPNWIYCKTKSTEPRGSWKRPLGGTFCPEQSDRNSIPTGTGDGEDVPDHETVGGELGTSRSMKTSQKNACWVASKRQRPVGKVVRNYQGGG